MDSVFQPIAAELQVSAENSSSVQHCKTFQVGSTSNNVSPVCLKILIQARKWFSINTTHQFVSQIYKMKVISNVDS